jgi:hypothetical protein
MQTGTGQTPGRRGVNASHARSRILKRPLPKSAKPLTTKFSGPQGPLWNDELGCGPKEK